MLKAFNLLDIFWDYDIIVTTDLPSLGYYPALGLYSAVLRNAIFEIFVCFSVRPGVPDRSTKPSVCETKPTSSYNDTVRHLLANPNPPVPKIDRSLKARMILKTQACSQTTLKTTPPIHPILYGFLRMQT